MAGLVLNLRPDEKFIVNGVILQNGSRRSQIRVEDENANVLRVRDAIHPDDVNTPVKRAYFAAQLIISCDVEETEGVHQLEKALAELLDVFRFGEAAEHLARASEAVSERRFYSVLCQLKKLLPLEEALFAYAQSHGADGDEQGADSDRQVA